MLTTHGMGGGPSLHFKDSIRPSPPKPLYSNWVSYFSTSVIRHHNQNNLEKSSGGLESTEHHGEKHGSRQAGRHGMGAMAESLHLDQ